MGKKFTIVTTNGLTFAFGKGHPTEAEAVEYANQVVARREKIAGRELSARELIDGVAHKEDRPVRQRIADEQWRPYADDASSSERNPFRAAREQGLLDRGGKRETRAEMWQRVEREEDAKLAAEDAKTAYANDARRQSAISHAENLLETVLFDPAQPESVVVRARQLVQQAKQGRLDAFKQLANDFSAVIDGQKEARAKALDEQIATLRGEKRELFEPDPPPLPAVTEPGSWSRYNGLPGKTEAEFQEGQRRTEEFDRRRMNL